MVHLFSVLVAAATLILILAGGFVTSTGSGLAVPDWPNTYGWFMFAFPLDKMVGGIFWEHSHRLIASTVGFMILVLAFWLGRVEPRPWVRRLGFIALAAVITQGILGGITVLWFLPAPISISHAGLAQVVFCLAVAIAVFTSRGWERGYAVDRPSGSGGPGSGHPALRRSSGHAEPESSGEGPRYCVGDRVLQRVAIATTALVYAQIIAGATMRHTGAGLAIPDFPLAFGGLLPPHWTAGIAIHFAHRAGAVLVTVMILATTLHVFAHQRDRGELVRPSILLLALLCLQLTLGAYVIWTGRHFVVNSLHVATGASVLATSLVLTLRAHRARFGSAAPHKARVAA